MPVNKSLKARTYIFRRYFKLSFSFTIVYFLFCFAYVSNIKLLYPSSIYATYKDVSSRADNFESVVLEFDSKLKSIEFLEKIRSELDYRKEFDWFEISVMKLKMFSTKLLPKNLTPNAWTFDINFLKQNIIWEELQDSINIRGFEDSQTFEIHCSSESPTMSQAICEKTLYLISYDYLEKKYSSLLDTIELYTKDPNLLTKGESISRYKRRLKRLRRQLDAPLMGPTFKQISESQIDYYAANFAKPFYISLLLFLMFLVIYETFYRTIIRTSDYIYFAKSIQDKTQLDIKGSFNNELDSFDHDRKGKYYESCMVQLKSILWTIEHESTKTISTLFLLGFRDLKSSPFLGSFIENISTISGEKKFLVINFSPELCQKMKSDSANMNDFLIGQKKWKECYEILSKENVHYTEVEYVPLKKDIAMDKLTKTFKLLSRSYDKIVCIGPASNIEFVQQRLMLNSDDIFLLLRTKSSKWRHLSYFLEELKNYRTKLRTSWVINSLY